jgi:hypothetical protein
MVWFTVGWEQISPMEVIQMEYEVFERDFMNRTLRLIEQYHRYVMPEIDPSNQFEVTLVLNCLLGLLVLPKELCSALVPDKPIVKLKGWGLKVTHIENAGHNQSIEKITLKEVIRCMRNSVAHMKLQAIGSRADITAIKFTDLSGFCINIPTESLLIFVKKLASSVIQCEKESDTGRR